MNTLDYFEYMDQQRNKLTEIMSSVGTIPSLTDGTNNVIQNAQLPLYRNAFVAIIATLEARDKYTCHHSERVSIMAERFCRCLNLMPWQIQVIEVTATVHDIGKVGISDATLKKAGKLDDDEWKEMKSHSSIGEDIILKAGKLNSISEGVRSHHERWNGTGYPDGLQGEEIPYSARVIAICDSVDAMMSTRVYRKALTPDVCKSELRKGRGVMYQADLVDIFLNNWDSIVGILYVDEI